MGVSYIQNKAIALFLRALVRPRLHLHPKPDETILIPSRDAGRTIKTHVYKPKSAAKQPGPVLINFCGSGFILRTFGSDDEYCRYLADNTDHTVIDVQYRLAPEHPFPAAFEDAEDVVSWARSDPARFDLGYISLSGFSAGANIALAVSSSSAIFCPDDQSAFRTVMSFYGPTDMVVPTPEKPQADSSNFIMRRILPPFSHLCHQCLNPNVVDPTDSRISPTYADADSFPDNVLLVTAAQCPFAIEAEKLAEYIGKVDGKYVVCRRMENCAHGWDKEAIRGTSQCKAKDEAYAMAASMLKRRENGAVKDCVLK